MKTIFALIVLSLMGFSSFAQKNTGNEANSKPVKEFTNVNFNSFYDLTAKLDTNDLKVNSKYTSDSAKITVYNILSPLTFINCSVSLSLIASKQTAYNRQYTNRKVSIDSVIFQERVKFIHTNHKGFFIQNAIFRKSCVLGFADTKIANNEKAEVVNTAFNANITVYNEGSPDTSGQKSLGQYAFIRNAENNQLYNISFVNAVFNKNLTIRSANLKNVKFANSAFNIPLILSYKTLDSTIIENCKFDNVIDIRSTKLLNGSVFRDNFFTKKCNIILRANDEIDFFYLDNISLRKVFFIIDWNWKGSNLQYVYWDNINREFLSRQTKKTSSYGTPAISIISSQMPELTEPDLEQIKLKFQNIKDHISKNNFEDDLFGSGKQRVFSWLDYQEKQYEKLYYRSNGNHLNYFWLCFLEKIVNFGYKGEGVFLFYCVLIISFFALIYRIYFANEIEAYVNDAVADNKEMPVDITIPKSRTHRIIHHVVYLVKILNIDFIKSFFASFAIFFTPKFPFKVYKYSSRFSWFVIGEWLIGIFFILLFLYFIAGNYPVVTKLIGF